MQINLLICQVNDVIDLNQIEKGQFSVKNKSTSPLETLKFVLDIFQQQAKAQNSHLRLKVVMHQHDAIKAPIFEPLGDS